jgi:hypothetical protein
LAVIVSAPLYKGILAVSYFDGRRWKLGNMAMAMPQIQPGVLVVGIIMALIILFGILDTVGVIHV